MATSLLRHVSARGTCIIWLVVCVETCFGEISAGTKYYRLLRDSQVTLGGTSLIANIVVQTKKCCAADCSRIEDCFGFEYDSNSKRCRLIRGSGRANTTSFPSAPYVGVDVYWMHGITTPLCETLPDYGQFATITGFAASSKAFNSTITLECKKWSAFNTAQLVEKGYVSGGPTTGLDFEDMFTQKITLRCAKNGSWVPGPEFVPECQDFINCLRTPRGKEYRGTAFTVSETGKACRPWSSVPGVTEYNAGNLGGLIWAGGNLGSQSNYCRNPGRDKIKPWCYVGTGTSWEYCNITMCEDPTLASLECRFTTEGYEYLGKANRTLSNQPCVSWDFPYARDTKKYSVHFPDDDATITHNYCRNPGRDDSQLWCYVAQAVGNYAYCSSDTVIRMCPGYP